MNRKVSEIMFRSYLINQKDGHDSEYQQQDRQAICERFIQNYRSIANVLAIDENDIGSMSYERCYEACQNDLHLLYHLKKTLKNY